MLLPLSFASSLPTVDLHGVMSKEKERGCDIWPSEPMYRYCPKQWQGRCI